MRQEPRGLTRIAKTHKCEVEGCREIIDIKRKRCLEHAEELRRANDLARKRNKYKTSKEQQA